VGVLTTQPGPFEAAGTVEVFVPKEIIARRIQDIFAGPNKDRKSDHYLVVWEGYPLKKDYTWEPIENLYGHEDLETSPCPAFSQERGWIRHHTRC
jgi:hypothetical protein